MLNWANMLKMLHILCLLNIHNKPYIGSMLRTIHITTGVAPRQTADIMLVLG